MYGPGKQSLPLFLLFYSSSSFPSSFLCSYTLSLLLLSVSIQSFVNSTLCLLDDRLFTEFKKITGCYLPNTAVEKQLRSLRPFVLLSGASDPFVVEASHIVNPALNRVVCYPRTYTLLHLQLHLHSYKYSYINIYNYTATATHTSLPKLTDNNATHH